MTAKMAQKGSSVKMFLMRMRVSEANCSKVVVKLKTWWMTGRRLATSERTGLAVGGIVFAFAGGAAALRDGGEGFDREGEEGVDDDEAEEADADPDEAVVEEDAGEMELEGVLFGGGPVAGDGVDQAHADGIEDGGPEVLERAPGAEDDIDDEIDDEEATPCR